MKRFWLLSLVLTIALTVFLTACGSGDNNSEDTSDNTQSEESATDSTEVAEPAEPVTLKLLYWDPGQQQVMEEINAKFTEENPNITVELEQVPGDQYDSVLRTRLLADDGPDVFMYFGGGAYALGKDGLLADLTNESYAESVLPGFRGSVSYEGKLYAVPLNAITTGAFYNKAAFEKAGITKEPENWAEFLEISEKLKQAGIVPIARGAKDAWTSLHEPGPMFAAFVLAKNENFQMDRYEDKFKFSTNPDMKNYFTKYVELIEKGYIDKGVLGMGHTQAIQEVADGRAGIMMGIMNFYGELVTANPDSEFGYFAVRNEEGQYAVSGASDKAIGVWSKTKHDAEARKLVAFYAKPEINALFVTATQTLPAIKGVTPDLAEPLKELIADNEKVDTIFTWFDGQWGGPAVDAHRTGVQNLHAGNPDVDALLAAIDKAYDDNKSIITPPTSK
jgi:raffinose/stachyose/melibiose transport system substrate-binding protein